jgi:hypothetical protein
MWQIGFLGLGLEILKTFITRNGNLNLVLGNGSFDKLIEPSKREEKARVIFGLSGCVNGFSN